MDLATLAEVKVDTFTLHPIDDFLDGRVHYTGVLTKKQSEELSEFRFTKKKELEAKLNSFGDGRYIVTKKHPNHWSVAYSIIRLS